MNRPIVGFARLLRHHCVTTASPLRHLLRPLLASGAEGSETDVRGETRGSPRPGDAGSPGSHQRLGVLAVGEATAGDRERPVVIDVTEIGDPAVSQLVLADRLDVGVEDVGDVDVNVGFVPV